MDLQNLINSNYSNLKDFIYQNIDQNESKMNCLEFVINENIFQLYENLDITKRSKYIYIFDRYSENVPTDIEEAKYVFVSEILEDICIKVINK